MKTKLYYIIIFLFIGIHIKAQIKGQVQIKREAIKTIREIGFDRIISDENFYIEDIGSPELPVLLKSYLIPIDADKVAINIQHVNKQKINGQFTVYPAQPPVTVGDINSTFVAPNPKIYESEKLFPDKRAEIISDNLYLGYRIVTVRLYPVEYNPQKKELYVCNIDFTIDYSTMAESSQSNEFFMQTQSLYRYELNKKNVKFRVENPEAVDNYDTKIQKIIQGKTVMYDYSSFSNEEARLRSQSVSAINEQTPEYIIITNNALKSSFQSLADWKTKKGIFTIIVTTEDINANYLGSDLPEKIRNYIISANNRWGTGLYILLGGDINIIPARYVRGHDALSYPADRYYYTSDSWSVYKGNVFNATTYLSTINILGRVPVSTAQEVTTYINKIIAYEKANNLGDLNYLKNNLYADAYISDYSGNLSEFAMSNIKKYANDYVSSWINNKFIGISV